MKKKLLFSLLTGFISVFAYGQEETGQKKFDHYVGVQANQLLRQLFSFSSSNTVIENPYLLSYSFNSSKSGWGFASGLGYTHSEVKEGDPTNPLETTINDFSFRAGVERKKMIGKKWMISYGFDFLLESLKNKTVSEFDFGDITTETQAKTWGIGPRFSLNFHISERVVIGTDGSYYFKKTKETQEVTDQDDITEKFKQFSFTVPAVLFVYVKL